MQRHLGDLHRVPTRPRVVYGAGTQDARSLTARTRAAAAAVARRRGPGRVRRAVSFPVIGPGSPSAQASEEPPEDMPGPPDVPPGPSQSCHDCSSQLVVDATRHVTRACARESDAASPPRRVAWTQDTIKVLTTSSKLSPDRNLIHSCCNLQVPYTNLHVPERNQLLDLRQQLGHTQGSHPNQLAWRYLWPRSMRCLLRTS